LSVRINAVKLTVMVVDPEVITNTFAGHFQASASSNNPGKVGLLKQS